MSLQVLKEYVLNYISALEDELEETKKERDRIDDDSFGFYECGVDGDGIPYSHGNSNDVYDDGFMWGSKVGEEDALLEVLKKIRELEGQ